MLAQKFFRCWMQTKHILLFRVDFGATGVTPQSHASWFCEVPACELGHGCANSLDSMALVSQKKTLIEIISYKQAWFNDFLGDSTKQSLSVTTQSTGVQSHKVAACAGTPQS